MEKYIEKLVPSHDGVIIISNNNPSWCTKTYQDDDDEIDSLTVPTVFFQAIWDTEFEVFSPFNIKKVFLPLAIFIILLGLSFRNPYAFFFTFYFAVTVLKDLLYFISLLYMYKRKNSPLYPTSMFHSAGNMVLNAYEKYQRIPTLEEAKKASKYHENGVYTYKIGELLFKLIGCIVLTLFCRVNLASLIGALFSLLLFWTAFQQLNVLKYSEYFILSTPTDKQLELVIGAFKNLESSEEKIERYDKAIVDTISTFAETMRTNIANASKSQKLEETDETKT